MLLPKRTRFESLFGVKKGYRTHLQASAHSGLTNTVVSMDVHGLKCAIALTDRLLGAAIHESFQRFAVDLNLDTGIHKRSISTTWKGTGERNVTD